MNKNNKQQLVIPMQLQFYPHSFNCHCLILKIELLSDVTLKVLELSAGLEVR